MPAYSLPAETYDQLVHMVERIEANPGNLIDPKDYEDVTFDMDSVRRTLPADISEEDLVGILKLALLTECATDSYAAAIAERGKRFDAHWLVRFNEKVWVPDEYNHAEPFKIALMSMGIAEEELDREIRETQEKEFVHVGGDTPVNVCTFGMVQEYLTDHYHGLIAKTLKPGSPDAARMAFHIKQRETLHMMWYRDMAAIQVAAVPQFIYNVSDELSRFRLPGHSLIPQYQSHATEWLPKMGADIAQLTKDLVRHIYGIVGDTKQLGRMATDIAGKSDYGLTMLQGWHIRWALDRGDGWGNQLVGEALLERLGLSFLYKAQNESDGFRGRIRAAIRSWLAAKLPTQLA